MLKTVSSFALAATCFVAFAVRADELQVKELRHDVHSVNGMIPDGAQPIDGKTNQDTKVTFNQPGVYVITCKIHTLMGMMCVVVVGDPVNIDQIDPSALPARAKAKILTLLNQIKNR